MVVPLYVDDRADNVAYIIHDAGIKVLLVNDNRQWETLSQHIDENSTLKRVVCLKTPDEECDDNRLASAKSWLPDTAKRLPERGGDPDKMASIVYTSGTTGRPKGVMLSHRNILSVAEGAGLATRIREGQRVLSFLPLSHKDSSLLQQNHL